MNTIFNSILDRAGFCQSVFISGGAVVDFNKAGDIDLFFGKGMHAPAEKFVEGFEIRSKYTAGYGSHTVIGSVYDPKYKKIIQVIVAQETMPQEIVGDFDISTHMWWYDRFKRIMHHPNATTVHQPPQVVKVKPKTLERYVKICLRYGYEPNMEVLKKCMVVGDDDEKQGDISFDLETINTLTLGYSLKTIPVGENLAK